MNSKKSNNTIWHNEGVLRQHREKQNKHKSAVLWFTGLSGSGKSTLAYAVEAKLYLAGSHTFVLNGDNVRHGLCSNLGFSAKDRSENSRRVSESAKLLMEAGSIVLTALISPFRADRENARKLFSDGDFIEIYCSAPLNVCEARDVKGLYKNARNGNIPEFTGVSSPYEPPLKPELLVPTGEQPLEKSVEQILNYCKKKQLLKA